MILMIGKRIRGGICHAIHQYPKANNESSMMKIKNHYIFNIGI